MPVKSVLELASAAIAKMSSFTLAVLPTFKLGMSLIDAWSVVLRCVRKKKKQEKSFSFCANDVQTANTRNSSFTVILNKVAR